MDEFSDIKLATNNPFKKGFKEKVEFKNMDTINNNGWENYVKWKNEKKVPPNYTSSEVEFVKQMFDILEDYPSFKNKLTQVGSKVDVFRDIQQYLKEKNK